MELLKGSHLYYSLVDDYIIRDRTTATTAPHIIGEMPCQFPLAPPVNAIGVLVDVELEVMLPFDPVDELLLVPCPFNVAIIGPTVTVPPHGAGGADTQEFM